MSTYFESINDNTGLIQINDSYTTYAVHRTGQVNANINKGVVYGFSLLDTEVLVGFRVPSGTVFISPVLLHNGTRVQYVTCDSDQPISFFTYAPVNAFPSTPHGAGMEIYSAEGKLVYSSEYPAARYVHFQALPFRGSYDSANVYFNGDGSWDAFSISDSGKRYVVAYTTPWIVTPGLYNDTNRYSKIAGFTFSEGNIKTERNPRWGGKGVHIHTLKGFGNIGHFGTIYYTSNADTPYSFPYFGGIFSFDYCFSLMDVIA